MQEFNFFQQLFRTETTRQTSTVVSTSNHFSTRFSGYRECLFWEVWVRTTLITKRFLLQTLEDAKGPFEFLRYGAIFAFCFARGTVFLLFMQVGMCVSQF